MSQNKRESAKDRLLRTQKEEIEKLKRELAAVQTVVKPDYDKGHDQEIRIRIIGIRPGGQGGTGAKYDVLEKLLKFFMETKAGPLDTLMQKFFMAYNPKTARKGYIDIFESQKIIEVYYDEKAHCKMWKYIYKEYPSGAGI
jgi:hypothetical protein